MAFFAGLALVLLAGGTAFGARYGDRLPWSLWFPSTDSQSEVVKSIEFGEDITLLRLGIQGLRSEENAAHIGSWKVPGTGQSMYLEYSYSAMLGVDGSQVEITRTADKAYRIAVPEFSFIGYDDFTFRTVIDDGGLLSFVTPDLDKEALATSILTEEARQQHVADNRELLVMQCENFYAGIVRAIDPEIVLEFEYAGQ